ncbi:MAG TPA: aminotransferase class V-fold PLP-dependent enzyme [Bacteroidetes bacterium]|nr:aminotransferase class V-fold PLP-dependent enzyme [Bacteroidota bacterium]
MSKYSFLYDYAEGAHPDILNALINTNMIQQLGYGEDEYCLEAVELIKKEFDAPAAEIHFVSGGTQANMTVISSVLKPYESVIAAQTGHIAVHETGAIEFTGHKINTIKTVDGKLTPELIKPVLIEHCDEHMVVPKLVYISNSTELGTIYTKSDLEKLNAFCKENDLLLFMDGARLGSSLTSKYQDLTAKDIRNYVDVFYIGGTKNGALAGEAIVLLNDDIKEKFRYSMKQKGALLAKSRLFGVQFSTLFKNRLFFDLAAYSNKLAYKLAEGIDDLGYDFVAVPQTNIIFPVIPDKTIKKLEKKFMFYPWQKYDENNTIIRLVTSWATKEDKIDEFLEELKQ